MASTPRTVSSTGGGPGALGVIAAGTLVAPSPRRSRRPGCGPDEASAGRGCPFAGGVAISSAGALSVASVVALEGDGSVAGARAPVFAVGGASSEGWTAVVSADGPTAAAAT